MSATTETFLDESDYETIGEEFRKLFNTRRLALEYPTATILRYTEYPNPESLTETTITHSGLNISESIIGRSLNLVEGGLDEDYIVTGYTPTSITVSGATFLATGFSTACTFHIDGLKYRRQASPTKVQVTSVGSESLLNRDVAYYNLSENEIRQFNNELDMFDRRFVFYDVVVENNDIIVLSDQEYAVYRVNYSITYGKTNLFGKAIRKD